MFCCRILLPMGRLSRCRSTTEICGIPNELRYVSQACDDADSDHIISSLLVGRAIKDISGVDHQDG